jgi:hypothetical protein
MAVKFKRAAFSAAIFCLGTCLAFAGEIRTGATMQVKANSIWFQHRDKFAHWQRLKQSGAAALASYQAEALSHRDAWQFIEPLTVRIIGYEAGKERVSVEMMTPGRLSGSRWWLDEAALVR